MSFSSEIKEKLCGAADACAFCSAALLAGVFRFAGRARPDGLLLATENRAVAALVEREFLECFGIEIRFAYKASGRLYSLLLQDEHLLENVKERLFPETEAELEQLFPFQCCKAAFVRGAFLGGGSISDPEKNYHLEFDAGGERAASELAAVLEQLGAASKMTRRKNRCIVYIKGYETIADVLGIVGAGSAALEIYNVSIEKEIRNQVNRQVNCENANIDKVAQAYCKHLQAIEKIKRNIGLDKLPESLQEIARVRLEYPDESLKELGKRLEKPIGKSGVNHRLNRLIALAEELK